MGKRDESKNRNVENGRIKGTSAFNIQQADSIDEISWSNNNSSSAELEREDKNKNCRG